MINISSFAVHPYTWPTFLFQNLPIHRPFSSKEKRITANSCQRSNNKKRPVNYMLSGLTPNGTC